MIMYYRDRTVLQMYYIFQLHNDLTSEIKELDLFENNIYLIQLLNTMVAFLKIQIWFYLLLFLHRFLSTQSCYSIKMPAY